MIDSSDRMQERRRGVALVMALAATVLVGSLALAAMQSALVRTRLVGDARWQVEGGAIAATALATIRLTDRLELDSLADGSTLILPTIVRPDGWSWSAAATRNGSLIRVSVTAIRAASDGTTYAARRASLLLSRDPADTVRVLAQRARF